MAPSGPSTATKSKHNKNYATILHSRLTDRAISKRAEAGNLFSTGKPGDQEAKKRADDLLAEAINIETAAKSAAEAAEKAYGDNSMDIDSVIDTIKNNLKNLDGMDWGRRSRHRRLHVHLAKPGPKKNLRNFRNTNSSWMWSFDGRVEARAKVGFGNRLIVARGPRRFCIYRLVASSTWSGIAIEDIVLVKAREGFKKGNIQIKGVAYADKENVGPDLTNPSSYGPGKGRFPATYVKVCWPDIAEGGDGKSDTCTYIRGRSSAPMNS